MFKPWLTALSCCAILILVLQGCQDTLINTPVSEAPTLEQIMPAPEALKSSEDYVFAIAEMQGKMLSQAMNATQTMEQDE